MKIIDVEVLGSVQSLTEFDIIEFLNSSPAMKKAIKKFALKKMSPKQSKPSGIRLSVEVYEGLSQEGSHNY
jgi:hypothetical protein